MRFNFIKRLVDFTPKDVMQRIAARIAKLGWHIVVYFEHADLDEMGPFLKSLPTTLVFDHMACPNVKKGVDGKHFQSWLKALDANKSWITKVTCPERFTLPGRPMTTWCRSRAPSSSASPTACCGAPTGRIPTCRRKRPTTACWST